MSEHSECGCSKDEKNKNRKTENKALAEDSQNKSNKSELNTKTDVLSIIAAQLDDQIITDSVDSTTSNRIAEKNNDLEDKRCTPCKIESCINSENSKIISEPLSKNEVVIIPQEKSELSDNDKFKNKSNKTALKNNILEEKICTPCNIESCINPESSKIISESLSKNEAVIIPQEKYELSDNDKFKNNSNKTALKNNVLEDKTCTPCLTESSKIISEPLSKNEAVIIPQEKSKLSDNDKFKNNSNKTALKNNVLEDKTCTPCQTESSKIISEPLSKNEAVIIQQEKSELSDNGKFKNNSNKTALKNNVLEDKTCTPCQTESSKIISEPLSKNEAVIIPQEKYELSDNDKFKNNSNKTALKNNVLEDKTCTPCLTESSKIISEPLSKNEAVIIPQEKSKLSDNDKFKNNSNKTALKNNVLEDKTCTPCQTESSKIISEPLSKNEAVIIQQEKSELSDNGKFKNNSNKTALKNNVLEDKTCTPCQTESSKIISEPLSKNEAVIIPQEKTELSDNDKFKNNSNKTALKNNVLEDKTCTPCQTESSKIISEPLSKNEAVIIPQEKSELSDNDKFKSNSNKTAVKNNALEDKIDTPCKTERCIKSENNKITSKPLSKNEAVIEPQEKSELSDNDKFKSNSNKTAVKSNVLGDKIYTPCKTESCIKSENNKITSKSLSKNETVIEPQETSELSDNDKFKSNSNKTAVKNNALEDKIDTPCKTESCIKSENNKITSEPLLKNVVIITPQEISELSEDKLKDDSLGETEIETDEKETLSNELRKKSGKGGKNYYYTQPETNLLKDIKRLFKTKLKRKNKTCLKCVKEVDKIPENDCTIKVEAWEKHDKEKCASEDKDYKFVGKLLFPVCSKDLFYQAPGIPIKNSQKSYTLNDPDTFGKQKLEKRQYAYAEKIIPVSLLDWAEDDQKELEDWMVLHPGTSRQVGNCNICK